MKNKISTRDLEALSAYLDGQMATSERAQLESQLKRSPELKNMLEQLQQTRQLIRSLPKVRAPRNFTLSPQISVVKSKQSRAYPALRLASVLATFLLGLVLLSDFWGPRLVSRAPVIEGLSVETIDHTQAIAATEPTEAPAEAEAPEDVVSEPVEKAAEVAQADSQTPEATMEAARLGVPGQTEEPPSAMLAVEEQPETEEAAELESEIQLVPPTIQEQIPAEPDLTSTTAVGVISEKDNRLFTIRILEVILALVALSTAVAALYLRRGAGV